MTQSPMQLLQKQLLERYPNDESLHELIKLSVKHERAAIECAYASGANDVRLEKCGYEPVTADKYYFMRYISND
mgnify:CR=1 FL=1